MLFALFGEPALALAVDPTVLFALFGESTLALALRYADDVRTRDLFCSKNIKSGADDVRPQLIEAIFAEAELCLTLTRQVKDS